jgi:hypothetical protein
MYLFIISLVLLIPLLGISLYKQQGKKQIFQLDVVQFIYLFVFMPFAFVWAKSFLFYILSNEVQTGLTARDNFVIDTTFSIVAFYLFSAVSIHSITKTLALHKKRDPDFDIFHMSEYFHLWWSHIFIFVGSMFALTFLSTLNVFFPMVLTDNKLHLYGIILMGVLMGVMSFFSIWMADPKQHRRKFLRMMKSCLMIFAIYHVLLYFLLEPKFSMAYAGYWLMLTAFFSATISGFSFVRSKKVRRLQMKFTPADWGNNIDLFHPKGPLTKQK